MITLKTHESDKVVIFLCAELSDVYIFKATSKRKSKVQILNIEL